MAVTSTIRAPKTIVLVLLGVPHSYRSDFMVGDFATIKYYLELSNMPESPGLMEFWSTIDLVEYCRGPHPDFKTRSEFGEKGVYSRFRATHRQDHYTIVGKDDLLGKFGDWMHAKAYETEKGDVVNVISCTHGNIEEGRQGNLEFGSRVLEPSHLVELMRLFKDGVQFNFVTNACGSGGIIDQLSDGDKTNRLIVAAAAGGDQSSGNGLVGWRKGISPSGRFRSSYFTEVIVKSLGKINLDGIGGSIGDLGAMLQEGVYEKPQPFDAKSQPQLDGSTASQADTVLQQILHLDYMDFPQNPTRASRFLRQELHLQVILQAFDVDDWGYGNCEQSIKALFTNEIAKTDYGYLDNDDSYLLSGMELVLDPTMRRQRIPLSHIMKELQIRARIQSSFFSVLMQLVDACLVTLEGLHYPMKLESITDPDVRSVIGVLGCFEKVRLITWDWKKFFGPDIAGFEACLPSLDGYLPPVYWLATLIVRGTVVENLNFIMNRIELIGELGKLDRIEMMKFWPTTRKLVRNLNAGIKPPERNVKDSHLLAFWLPRSMGPSVTIENIYEEFDAKVFIPLESLCFEFFGLETNTELANEKLSAGALKEVLTDGTMEF
ncbi:hypothetical protein LZ554_000638 [Drepanopeziza brunnea f. sp. 'monogermtubi']|nr:hypothetical protein LZ554_000638 [Drepanopeziza brunnea f. sp. 'monogermtubi']